MFWALIVLLSLSGFPLRFSQWKTDNADVFLFYLLIQVQLVINKYSLFKKATINLNECCAILLCGGNRLWSRLWCLNAPHDKGIDEGEEC